MIVQIATAAALVVAAVGLARRGEPLLRWVAVAVVLGGIAKVDYALFPPVGADSVHLGDILRVIGWGVAALRRHRRDPHPDARARRGRDRR